MSTPLKNTRRIFAVKIILTALVGGVDLYCLYAIIGQLVIWSQQPRFQNVVTGGKSVSAGFLLQTAVFAALFLLLSAALVFMAIRFFGKRKQTAQDPFADAVADMPKDADGQTNGDTAAAIEKPEQTNDDSTRDAPKDA